MMIDKFSNVIPFSINDYNQTKNGPSLLRTVKNVNKNRRKQVVLQVGVRTLVISNSNE